MSVPALLSLVLPQLTNALAQPISLPSGRDLGGFTPTVLGVRGVPKAGGGFSHVGVYLDLAFDPALAALLRVAADTRARVLRFEVPSSEEMSVRHAGGPKVPHLELGLEGEAPAGAVLEYQVRIDGGSWSPFVLGPVLSLERAELLVQGVHQVAVRARSLDDPRSLDPSPTLLTLVVDTEPPVLAADVLAGREGAIVKAQDVVSGDRLRLELVIDGVARPVALDDRQVVYIPELSDGDRRVELRATDEVGLASTVVLQKGVSAAIGAATAVASSSGCRCVSGDGETSAAVLGAMLLLLGRRRRRAR
jgi:MYXO-CTERM domain-containing protein